jgi:hypothetical protein
VDKQRVECVLSQRRFRKLFPRCSFSAVPFSAGKSILSLILNWVKEGLSDGFITLDSTEAAALIGAVCQWIVTNCA